jgi:hypothetical protein
MKKVLPLALLVFLPLVSGAYEAVYQRTAVGAIEVKDIPRRIALEATAKSPYFQGDNNLFRSLFRYIQRNEVAMTVPVEAEMKPGKMRFFVGRKDAAKKLSGVGGVEVKNIPRLKVASIGIRGSYSEDRFQRYKQRLLAWLAKNPQYEVVSPPYAVYWNSPLVPGIFKRSEIHVPIRTKATQGEEDKPKPKSSEKLSEPGT